MFACLKCSTAGNPQNAGGGGSPIHPKGQGHCKHCGEGPVEGVPAPRVHRVGYLSNDLSKSFALEAL